MINRLIKHTTPTIKLKIGWEEALKEMWGRKLAKAKIKALDKAIIEDKEREGL